MSVNEWLSGRYHIEIFNGGGSRGTERVSPSRSLDRPFGLKPRLKKSRVVIFDVIASLGY